MGSKVDSVASTLANGSLGHVTDLPFRLILEATLWVEEGRCKKMADNLVWNLFCYLV